MAMFILLTAEEARSVRGPSAVTAIAALDPIERQGGVFILGVAVLSDPAHAEFHDRLAALPQMDLNDPAFPAAIDLPE